MFPQPTFALFLLSMLILRIGPHWMLRMVLRAPWVNPVAQLPSKLQADCSRCLILQQFPGRKRRLLVLSLPTYLAAS